MLEQSTNPGMEGDSLTADFGRLIEMLLRQWRLIAGLTLVSAVLAVVVILILPRQYASSVLVSSTKITSLVSFGTEIETLTEEELLARSPATAILISRDARLRTYVEMVNNPQIARTVLDEYGERLEEDDRTVGRLLEMVEGEVAAQSDSIRITVTYKDPVLAADIANTWGQEYVRLINTTYGGASTQEIFDTIRNQTSQSLADYNIAQTNLEQFIARDRSGELERQILDREQTIVSLTDAQRNIYTSILSQRANSSLAAFSQQLDDVTIRLGRAYSDLRSIDVLLDDIADMIGQVQEGGEGAAASNELALTILKSQVFGTGEETSGLIIQTFPGALTANAMITDLISMETVLSERRSQLEADIQGYTDDLLALQEGTTVDFETQAEGVLQSVTGLEDFQDVLNFSLNDTSVGQRIQALEQEVRDLKSELAAEQSTLAQLTNVRDLAWATYTTLATKRAEVAVAQQTTGSEVALAAQAAVPEEDTLPGATVLLLAIVVGLFLGLMIAVSVEFWWAYRKVTPYPLTFANIRRAS